MEVVGLIHDNVTFVVKICASSHVGLVKESCKIFESIKEVYSIEPRLEHYGCLVDLLGRAGRLKETEESVKIMPMKPNAILWRSLLGAARAHGNVEMGEFALKHLIELEPETSGNYMLLSNIYASFDTWDDVKRVRKLMKHHRINKMPGSSLVAVNGSMHEFIRIIKICEFVLIIKKFVVETHTSKTVEITIQMFLLSRRLQHHQIVNMLLLTSHRPRKHF
ncbi:hypothetical protein CFOL_v3_00151 [Cephalotus follicularis]|uniref:PPR domain-containing protein/PPR_2 domain-containing protein n=1 Tax=Cephalotus follicularis TaxID=3775 RepID=A0A1Q3ALI8_CEPFO|nr:hypothetical protein CFOL_v3_00151 [Cephalotus follicularis]